MRSIDVLALVENTPAGSREININELSAEIAKQIKEGIKASVKEVPPEKESDPAEGSAEKEGDGNA